MRSLVAIRNPKNMEVHLRRLEDTTIEIKIAYTGTYNSEDSKDFLSGELLVQESDYENLLKALNKGRKYVKDHNRSDAVMVPFRLERQG